MFQKYLLPTTNVKRIKQEKKISPTTCGSTPWAPHPALPLQHFFSSTLDRQHQSTIHDNITIRQIQVPKCFTNTCFQLHTTSGESFLCPTFQQLTGCVSYGVTTMLIGRLAFFSECCMYLGDKKFDFEHAPKCCN